MKFTKEVSVCIVAAALSVVSESGLDTSTYMASSLKLKLSMTSDADPSFQTKYDQAVRNCRKPKIIVEEFTQCVEKDLGGLMNWNQIMMKLSGNMSSTASDDIEDSREHVHEQAAVENTQRKQEEQKELEMELDDISNTGSFSDTSNTASGLSSYAKYTTKMKAVASFPKLNLKRKPRISSAAGALSSIHQRQSERVFEPLHDSFDEQYYAFEKRQAKKISGTYNYHLRILALIYVLGFALVCGVIFALVYVIAHAVEFHEQPAEGITFHAQPTN